MPQDFDPDAWMAKQNKSATKPAPSTDAGFDPDAWMAKQSEPRRPPKPATVLPTERQEFGRRPATLDQSLTQSARVNRAPKKIDSGRMIIDEAHQAEWDSRSRALRQQRQQRHREAFERKPMLDQWRERAHEAALRGGGQVSKMARQTLGAIGGRLVPGGDVAMTAWQEGEEARMRMLEARKQSRPSSFATDIAEGVIEALPAAGLATLGGIATGGSLTAAAAMGGGMAAAGADWREPKRAAVQTALGAVAPVAGGVAGSRLGSAVASRLARPVAQRAAIAGGEVLGGAAGNVIGTGAEQLGFEGGLNARELAKSGIIGGALNVPGTASAARRPARTTQNIPESIPAAQPVTALRQQPEAAPVVPRVEPLRQTAEMQRPAPRQTAEIARTPTAPTRQIQYPDAPETQEMPAIRERIAAENAETRELPAVRRPTQDVAAAEVSPEIRPETPISETAPPRPPKATDDNIQALRDRQTELGREAYDRRGDFTGDLRDEYNRLNSIIREYDNARAPRELAPPPARGPERMTPPPKERAARREALQSRTGPMSETLTEGRKVTQEMQIPPALRPTEAFSSREDARQGYFERFNDDELVSEIARLEDVRNQGLRGRSKLSREQLEANNFDLRVAVEMQKERRRLQQQIGIEAGERIVGRTPARTFKKHPETLITPEAIKGTENKPARKIQHSTLGEVTESADQKGVPPGKLRVVDEATGKLSVIQNPRTKGNRSAAFVKGPAADASKIAAKEPWQMTQSELEATGYIAYDDASKRYVVVQQRAGSSETNRAAHKREILIARAAGKPVPPEVLADYPDLQPKAVPAGKLRVVDEATGKLSVIQNPRTKGNRSAAFVRAAPKAKSLAQFVKESGGIKPSIANRGELSYASRKESNRVAIINRRGIGADEMRRQAEEAGFGKWDTESEFLSALRDDVEGRKVFSTEREVDYEVEYRKSLSKDEEAELDGFEKFLNDKDAADTYDRVSGGDVSGESVKRLIQHAKQYGLADDSIEAIINEGRAARSSQGQASEILPNDVAGQSKAPIQAQLNRTTGPAAMPAAPMQAKPPDLVQGMKRIARTPSSPVEISQLRAKFPKVDKATFDAEMTRLNEQGKIALHRHDHPSSLSQAQRDSMVKIGNDYFTAATFREGGGEIMGIGLGGLQGMFKDRPKTPEPGQQALFESAPKRSLASRAASNVVSAATLPRALMASADLSAPLRQGAILSLPPTQWGRAAKSGIRMLQALRTSQYNRLVGELNNHPDAKVGKDSGLYMSTDPSEGATLRGREEDFISKWAGKIPIVKQSEQAYKTYLDSIRLETFKKYKRVIDGDKKLSLEQKAEAYKAAADWINVASGRGSLGKTLDKAMPALSTVFFAPRYAASRVQVLNPATYLKNSTTAAGRAVLKQQMSDLVQFGGVITATLALAKAAGAEVGTDPEDSDFMKIKIGSTRYDTLAGLQQFMRLYYKLGKDFGAAARDEKPEGRGAVGELSRFARSKAAPVPSFFVDFFERKDFIGRKFEMERGVKERVLPLMWKDFAEAYGREGFTGAAKLTPGFFGVGAQDFEKRPGNLSISGKVDAELRKHGLDYSSVSQIPGDTDETHRARGTKVEGWITEYGERLISHPRYQSLTPERQKAALQNLRERIGREANQKRPDLRNFRPMEVFRSVRESERERLRRDRGKLVTSPD